MRPLLLPLLALCLAGAPPAWTVEALRSVELTLEETAGLRRFGYPVTAHVPLPRGAAREPDALSLAPGVGVPSRVQIDPVSRWADGSLQWLSVHFNLSPGPHEKHSFRLLIGAPRGTRPAARALGEVRDAYRIRDVYHVPFRGPSFITSIRYGDREFLRAPARWEVSLAGDREPLAAAAGSETHRVIAAGPVNVIVERAGTLAGSGLVVRYRLTVAQPDSKSWFDATMEVRNDARRDLSLALRVPYAMEKRPLRWDLDVGSWLYGTLRDGQQAVLRQNLPDEWVVSLQAIGGGSQPTKYAAAAPGQRRFNGSGHLIDGALGGRAVAFGSPELAGRMPAGSGLTMTADGDVAFLWRFRGASHVRARALFHHVSDAVHVSAATSPAAMLSPLRVSLPAAWYRKCRAGRQPPDRWPSQNLNPGQDGVARPANRPPPTVWSDGRQSSASLESIGLGIPNGGTSDGSRNRACKRTRH